ncbi:MULTISPECIES: xylose isomerase [unclassified Pseudomonas]|jgi:xylose isomerase|uniref:xylose isomerase n=1 Tax=Pseudomonas TaxID=286 RepID=UPI0011A6B361|nr:MULTISPECIES: xylose isomerase [unclassified Pseudomonas]MBA4363287.1 xylose isomerase [Pseudomonas sp.]TWC23373.1 D-xylose isomerase [Pseudomonas sp. SJZ083]TWC49173.1 D-xylose isomerase [Pseudomonas sp. SJZ077]
MPYFPNVDQIRYEGPDSNSPLAFRHYDADKVILGKPMREHLRMAACYWHTFVWPGSDVFGAATFKRPWQHTGDPMEVAIDKAAAAFEFFSKLGIDYYCFHDTDVAPEGNSLKEYRNHFAQMVDHLERHQEDSGIKLLWGTANCFSNPRFAAGAASNPDPEVFACAAAQVFSAMNATQRLKGSNYVLWGGREGYETLLNTDLKREREQLGRFMRMVVEHKHKIGFKGDLLIEPKPQEPTKHQYDYDSATVFGFLQQFGLEKEIKVNIEANHATLAGHSFHHEIATAVSLGIFGSIDANRGDPQNGWDTDQFPNSVEEMTLVTYEILKAGGFMNGGFNFDSKVRRQSLDEIDLFHGHIGAMDVLALSLERAAAMVQNDRLQQLKDQRYSGWQQPFGQAVLTGDFNLQSLAEHAFANELNPQAVSGRQEMLENVVNRFIYR